VCVCVCVGVGFGVFGCMSVCVCVCLCVAQVIRHAMRMHHAVRGLYCRTIFSTLSHKLHDFRQKNVPEQKMCFLFPLQILHETFLIVRNTERDIIKNVYWCSCKVTVILVRF